MQAAIVADIKDCHAAPLGWNGFAEAIAGTRVPVYALGGLGPEDLDVAIAHGAHGVALRRGAWS